MKRLIPFVLSVVSALPLGACSSEFDPPSRLTKLRLLAVQADAPFARPSEEVALSALAVDPKARPLQWAWATCVNPQDPTVVGCLEAAGTGALRLGSDRATVRVPDDALAALPPEGRVGAMLGVLVVVCPGTIAEGETQQVPVRCLDPEGRALRLDEFEVGLKRIHLRERDRNANPAIAAITFDGAPWPEDLVPEVEPCDANKGNEVPDCAAKHRIAASVVGGEAGVDERGAQFTEQPVVQYYATDGTFEWDTRRGESPETTWAARTRGAEVVFWFVARDDRGGVTWSSRRARVRI